MDKPKNWNEKKEAMNRLAQALERTTPPTIPNAAKKFAPQKPKRKNKVSEYFKAFLKNIFCMAQEIRHKAVTKKHTS